VFKIFKDFGIRFFITKKEELLPLGFREGMFQVTDAKSTGMIGDLVRRLNQWESGDCTDATAVDTIKK
jgi:hypothetical protein